MDVKRLGPDSFEVTPADLEDATTIAEACVGAIFDLVFAAEGEVDPQILKGVIAPLSSLATAIIREGGPVPADMNTLVNLKTALSRHGGAQDSDVETALLRTLDSVGINEEILARLPGRPRAVSLMMNLGGILVRLGHAPAEISSTDLGSETASGEAAIAEA